jgi:hypothetical protein
MPNRMIGPNSQRFSRSRYQRQAKIWVFASVAKPSTFLCPRIPYQSPPSRSPSVSLAHLSASQLSFITPMSGSTMATNADTTMVQK